MNRYQPLSRTKSLLTDSLAKVIVFVGAVSGLLVVSGCQPKPVAQAPSSAPRVQAAAPAMDEAAETIAPAPEKSKHAQAHSVATRETKAPDDTAAAGKAVSIAGGWVNAGGACDSGASVFFNSDGTYMSEGEKGTWALSGKTLTVTTASTEEEDGSVAAQGPDESTGDSGEKAVLTLLSVTDDAARVILSNGSNASWTRCTS